MDSLKEFCHQRKLNKHLEDAFVTYIRSTYSSAYAIRSGETLSKMMSNMTDEKVKEMWGLFVLDLKQVLVEEQNG